jgi:glutathione synthase/RimK-type ligase-like ATP-grasp enzyme
MCAQINMSDEAICASVADILASIKRADDADSARGLLIDKIKSIPEDFGAWNILGNLLFYAGFTGAAHTAYSAAIAFRPNEAAAHANLANLLLQMHNPKAAKEYYDIALGLEPDLPGIHQGLAAYYQGQGQRELADYHQKKGYALQPVSYSTYWGRGEPIPILILVSALGGNIPWRLILDHGVFLATVVAVEYFDERQSLPPHRVVFNSIGDTDLCRSGLEAGLRLIERESAPVINHPAAVLKTGRIMNAERMARLPGVVAPRMAMLRKSTLMQDNAEETLAEHGVGFPVLLRSPGFHGGDYFVSVFGSDALTEALRELPGDELLAIEWLNSRSEDGLFRKYRVMSIDGILYPMHLAISSQWKVHYFTSDTAANEAHRVEEAAFLEDFPAVIGPEGTAALQLISRTLGLEYCGIDFGIDRLGNILLYEANATMIITPHSIEKKLDYRNRAIANAMAAAKRMLSARAGR